jgi:hypothetical protein
VSITTFYYDFRNKQGLFALISRLDPHKLWRIRVDEYDEKTRLQEQKYHVMIGDVARQCKHLNQCLDADSWKRLCVAQFRTDCIANHIPRLEEYWRRNEFRLMPSLDGGSLVQLGAQTREFPKYVAAGFIEWLYAYGSDNSVVWTEPEDLE